MLRYSELVYKNRASFRSTKTTIYIIILCILRCNIVFYNIFETRLVMSAACSLKIATSLLYSSYIVKYIIGVFVLRGT